MKPLIRWIIGPVYPAGFTCLKMACDQLRASYGDEVDYLVCCNQLGPNQMDYVKTIGVPVYIQDALAFPVQPSCWPDHPHTLEGTRNCWKLHPPRLRPEAHEIILDNDIVISRRLKAVDAFLQTDRTMIAEAHSRNYGVFADRLPEDVLYNSGIIGLPPGFDFESQLRQLLPDEFRWNGYFDEQGLVAAALLKTAPLIVGRDEVEFCGLGHRLPSTPGIHFIGVNSNDVHDGWRTFSARKLRLL